jgi:hypothetical protein
MYFKSGQASLATPLRQAVTERAPSFLTTSGGKRRDAPAAVSASSARALASAGVLAKKTSGGGSKYPVAKAASEADSGLVRRGRGTFSYKG